MKLNIEYLRHITEAATKGCPSDPILQFKDCQEVIKMCESEMLSSAKAGRDHVIVRLNPVDFVGSDTGKLIKRDMCIEHLRESGYTVEQTMYDGVCRIRISW